MPFSCMIKLHFCKIFPIVSHLQMTKVCEIFFYVEYLRFEKNVAYELLFIYQKLSDDMLLYWVGDIINAEMISVFLN